MGIDVYNVKRFGAKGDGTTDDRVSLQAAAAALTAGGHLHFPGGTYLSSGTITVAADKTTISGDGEASILKAAASSAHLVGLYGTGRTGILVTNLTVDMNKANRTGRSVGISFDASTDCKVVACVVQNCRGSGAPGVGISFGSNSTRTSVIGCTVRDNGTAGDAYFGDGVFMNATQGVIADNTFINCLDTGWVLEDCIDSVAEGNTSKTCGAGWAVTSSSRASSNIAVSGCVVNGYTATVTGGVQIAPLGAFDLSNVTISGCVFRGSAAAGASHLVYLRTPSTGRMKSIIFNGGLIDNGSGQSLRAETVTNLILNGVSVRDGAEFGLVITGCVDPRVIGCNVTDCSKSSAGTYSGIAFESCTRPVAQNNVVINSGTAYIANGIITTVAVTGRAVIQDNSMTAMAVGNYSLLSGAVHLVRAIGGASPEGALVASIGSTFHREDGGAATSLYVKVANNTNAGWAAVAEHYSGSATYDPASLADGVGATTTVTVTGAALGDYAEASFSLDLQGITVTSWVSADNTVSVRFQNESGGTLDLASGTLRARVRKA